MEVTYSNKSNTSTPEDFEGPKLIGTTGSFVRASLICLLIIAALIANIFVCLAVYKQRSARRITRYFIVNLCVADVFVTVISMPVWMIFLLFDNTSAYNLLGDTFVLIWIHVDILCGTASILSLTSISVDRYIAVTKPYSYVRFMTGKRALHIIGVIWMYSMIVAAMNKPLKEYEIKAYALFVMCASFLLPLFIIIVAYGSMFRVAMRHTRDPTHRANAECQRHHNRFKRDLKAAKTIGFVIGTFLCCWAPFIFVSVAYAFFPEINQVYASFTKWLSYLNAVLSPVVYTCVDKQLRCLVWKRLSKCCPKNRKGFISTKHERSFATSEYSRSTPLAIV